LQGDATSGRGTDRPKVAFLAGGQL
jgi:hypothetical protein